jgi:autotransporter adhesin
VQALATFKFADTGAAQTVGGNARGVDAVDLQPARLAVTQVASGNNSTIAGGRNNTASGQGAVAAGETNVASGADAVAMGAGNTASGQSAVAFGSNNIASADDVTVAGGSNNQSTKNRASVGGGSNNVASGFSSTVGGGISNTASGNSSLIPGGESNAASGVWSVATGFKSSSYLTGQKSHASGIFASVGDAQTSELIWRASTSNATPTEMFLDWLTQRATVPNNTTWAFHIIGVARRDNGDSISFEVKGAIMNNAGVVTLPAAVTAAVICDGTGTALTIANFVVSADDPNNSLKILVTGIGGQNWRWVSHARIVEVGF